MKKVYLLLACLYLFAMLFAGCQPDNHASDGTSSTTEPSASSSTVVPNENQEDELTEVYYHPYGADGDISLNVENCDILIQVAREANFAPEETMNLSIVFNFTIRHHRDGANAFFADENVQYADKDGNPTKDYVDVQYYLCYSRPILVRMYYTAEGFVYEAAQISEETVRMLKKHFSQVVYTLSAQQKQQIEDAWLLAMGNSLPEWCDEDGACCGVHYYGSYGGYDILFISGNLAVISEETIGSKTFTHNSSMALYAHKDGQFYLLRDLYENGDLHSGDVAMIYRRHVECQEIH